MQPQFLDLEPEFSDSGRAAYTILPVPYDGTSTWLKGADRGPAAIIEASAHLELFDLESGTEAYRAGIHTRYAQLDFSSPETLVPAVRQEVERELVAGRFPVVVGGEHSVSIGAIQAAAGQYDSLSVLQLDAHTDLRPEYEGSRYNHACVMARAREVATCLQCGIRSMDAAEREAVTAERFFPAYRIHDNDSWMEKALAGLGEAVYITVDLDVFDPGIMPSTGTPEPGGLSWYQVTKFLQLVFRSRQVIACDVVELCPSADRSPDFLAAKLIYKMITWHAQQKGVNI